MKKITLRTLAAAMSLMMLLTGCSEGNETDSSEARITTASQSYEESSEAPETTQGVKMPTEGDVIPWEGEGDPLAGEKSSTTAASITKTQTTTTTKAEGITGATTAAVQNLPLPKNRLLHLLLPREHLYKDTVRSESAETISWTATVKFSCSRVCPPTA